ncbi:uncharacterized protein F54H12.2-like [Ruditapes philippinarum]|uniref:uncharacterized protein F54H12.2-like n=1 Tax=Ruditapes philippinarum TaxID=129788 RepID=UPI00295B053C|nr:uncharacterized protein F54H12.2-like [Ruditapes philippinarum]
MEDFHQEELSLFVTPPADTSLQSREWITYRPVNQVTNASALEFNIPGHTSAYLDLKRSVLNLKLQIVKGDGSAVDPDEVVGPTNLPLHTVFSQVDVSLQQTPLSHTGINYPYKAYIDTILQSNENMQINLLTSQLFYKDTGDVGTIDGKTGSNGGLFFRYTLTKGSKIVEMEGPLHIDLFQQSKLLINGVSVGIKLHPTRDSFRLITDTVNPEYRVKIVDAYFKLCIQRLASSVLIAHEKLIQDTPAVYPYLRTEIKTTAIASGQFSYSADDIFQGLVPSKLIVGLVPSAAFNGDYAQNPFNFKHYNCSFVGLYVDGQSLPSQPMQPNYTADQYVECYRSLALYRSDLNISKQDYKKGYCLYALDIDPYYSFNTKRRGHCRLELKFAEALPESVTLIMYATFPEVLNIDKARAVYVK